MVIVIGNNLSNSIAFVALDYDYYIFYAARLTGLCAWSGQTNNNSLWYAAYKDLLPTYRCSWTCVYMQMTIKRDFRNCSFLTLSRPLSFFRIDAHAQARSIAWFSVCTQCCVQLWQQHSVSSSHSHHYLIVLCLLIARFWDWTWFTWPDVDCGPVGVCPNITWYFLRACSTLASLGGLLLVYRTRAIDPTRTATTS